MKMQFKNELSFVVKGRYALFSDPLTRIGGEKSSLMIPTYQALKGVLESCYWKPTITYIIDAVRVMKPIRTESKGIRPISYSGGNDLSLYNYLRDVEYQVKAHFEFNMNRPDLEHDRSENKHYYVAKRSIERGGRRDVYMGTRECQAYVEPVEFGSGAGCYDAMEEMDFGLMYHSIRYPDEIGKDEMTVTFWYPKMKNGIILFPRPEECPIERFVRKAKMKTFHDTNFSGLQEDELLEGFTQEGGIIM